MGEHVEWQAGAIEIAADCETPCIVDSALTATDLAGEYFLRTPGPRPGYEREQAARASTSRGRRCCRAALRGVYLV